MDILGFLVTLAFIGIAPRFGVDRAISGILTDAWAAGRETYHGVRRRYVHLAAKPVIIVTCAAIALQALALILAWNLLPHVNLDTASLAEGLHDGLMLLTIAGVLLMLVEGWYAYRSRLAIPHWLRNARGELVQFPEHLEHPEGNNALYVLPEEDEHAGQFLDRDGRFVNEGGVFVDADGEEIDEGHAQLHELAGTSVLDPAYTHRPGRFSLGWSLARVMFTFLVMGVWLATLGILASNTSAFMIGVTCIYAAIAIAALFAGFVAWFFLKGTKISEFIATVVSKEVLVALPGIKWSNIEQYIPRSGINIFDEDEDAAKVQALLKLFALYLAIPVMAIYAWTDPVFATYVLMFTFLATGTGVVLARTGGASIVANQNFKFVRLMRYVLPTFAVLAAIHALLPKDIVQVVDGQGLNLKSAIVGYGSGQESIHVHGAWSNVGSLILWLIVAGILAMAAKAVSPKDGNGSAIRRWAGAMLGAGVVLAIVASAWRGYGLIKNASGETTVSVPKVDVRTREQMHDDLMKTVSDFKKQIKDLKTRSATAPIAPPVQTDSPRGTKPPVRYAGKAKSRSTPTRPQGSRGSLDPSFVAEYRAITGEDP